MRDPGRLTARQRQVLDLTADGLTSQGIADQLGISARTVDIHRANLLRVLNARSIAHAVAIVLRAEHAAALSPPASPEGRTAPAPATSRAGAPAPDAAAASPAP
ncbi:MAG TPA: LuxR family transcriptional regulator [Novosphingobium sp.]|nr:LuxR family transcriptional regulator [Novosphingobium sp.]HZV11307.1 LuxR family transcriptional regulator [Novosphingobium sp.]